MSDIDDLRLGRSAGRIRSMFRPVGGAAASGIEGVAAARGAVGHEAGQGGAGAGAPPGERDVSAIAGRLRAAAGARARMSNVEAEGMARAIVRRARDGLEKMEGAPDGVLDLNEVVALEAVVHVRGRPAVRVLGDTLEDIRQYPESDLWAALADTHIANVLTTTSATSAVRVTDTLLPGFTWVQGTAFLVGPTLALTNRHVLFPPGQGTRLARRVPGTTTARLKREYEVLLDFAFDDGTPRKTLYRIVEIPFVAEDADPVDAALLKVEPVEGSAPKHLAISKKDVFDIDRLYIVGHPGRLPSVPDDVQMVFGDPDERKRVSFGMLMDAVVPGQVHVVHDASTIGGFSGAAVHGFAEPTVCALHYWGDAAAGNRAIAAEALRGHATLGPMLRA